MHCTQCGTKATVGDRFCSNCGAPLLSPKPTEGERKLVTVMFADVVGSTAMAEKLDPEQISEIMAGAFAFMNAAVARYGGTVSRLMGDAVLALFGAPVAHEDDPERAVRAALDIRDAAERYEHTVRQAFDVDFQVRVGLHTGLAVLATVGDAIRAEYTAMGDTPNVAARVQSAATPGTVLVTEQTLRYLREIVDFEVHAPVQAKGKSQALEVFVVQRIKEARGAVRGIAGLRSDLVGRDREMAHLLGALAGLGRGKGSTVILSGEAGLGKSRLVAELEARLPKGIRWFEGRAFSYGQSLVHSLWRDLLRTAIGATLAESATAVRGHLHAFVRPLALTASEVAAVETLLGVQSAASLEITGSLDAETFPEFLSTSLRRVIVAATPPEGSVVVFDDLHWGDSGSLALVETILVAAQSAPILFLLTHRPDKASSAWPFLERLRGRPDVSLLDLEPLDASASERLLDNLLEIRDLPGSIKKDVLARSDGNPFFVEEVLRSFIDHGHIFRDTDGTWRAHPDIVTVTIPETLAGVLTARLDRLPERARRVIQTASVIGRNFPYPVLAHVCDHADDALRIADPTAQMQTLTEEGLVLELQREPELDYAFKHALTQEAAYELLLLRRRRELHRRTGLAMESYYAERTDELAPVLARHFFEGDEWRRAARYASEGAERALEVYHNSQALDLRDLACRANERDPATPAPDACDAILAWAQLAFKVKTREEILERLDQAEKLAREMGDDRRLAQTLNWIGNAHILSGFPFDGLPALTESYEIGRRLKDQQMLVLPLFLTTMTMVDGDPEGSLGKLDEVIAAARTFKDKDVEAHTLGAKADALARMGRFPEAEATITEALEVAALTHSPIKVADVNSFAGLVYIMKGDGERATNHARTAIEAAMSVRGLDCAMYGCMVHGMARLASGDVEGAGKALGQASQMASDQGRSEFRFRLEGLATMARLRVGDVGAAIQLQRSLDDARKIGDVSAAAMFADQLGRAHLDAGAWDDAARELGHAIDYYRATGMRPSLADALEHLAKVKVGLGDAPGATALREEVERLDARPAVGTVGRLSGAPVGAV